MIIHSKFKDYNVEIESDLSFLNRFSNLNHVQYVVDEKVYRLYQSQFHEIPSESLILLKATEENKVIETALSVCETMTKLSAKRNIVLISIGGGIIQDITGFVANILYRGIKWIFVPTTLLASCDSCIGGKTSLNYKTYKNLLGTFYPPDSIYICPQFFKTLSDADYKSGLGEVVKFNIMAGPNGMSKISNDLTELLNKNFDTVNEYVNGSLEYKKRFIEADEFDKGERIKLNFAHTFGHAIEVISHYIIPHGTAVAIGMIMANAVAEERGILSKKFVQDCEKILLEIIQIDIKLLNASLSDVLNAIQKDKKQIDNGMTAVLMANVSGNTELKIVRDMTEREVKYAFDYFINLYKTKNYG